MVKMVLFLTSIIYFILYLLIYPPREVASVGTGKCYLQSARPSMCTHFLTKKKKEGKENTNTSENTVY
jgi:hypothetical protein